MANGNGNGFWSDVWGGVEAGASAIWGIAAPVAADIGMSWASHEVNKLRPPAPSPAYGRQPAGAPTAGYAGAAPPPMSMVEAVAGRRMTPQEQAFMNMLKGAAGTFSGRAPAGTVTNQPAGVPYAAAPRAISPSYAPLNLVGGTPPVEGFPGFSTAPYSVPPAQPASMDPSWLPIPQVTMPVQTPGCPTMFRAGAPSVRPMNMLEGRNPATGKMHYWKHMGRPLLFSGDLANCRRVGKVQARLNRSRPRKR